MAPRMSVRIAAVAVAAAVALVTAGCSGGAVSASGGGPVITVDNGGSGAFTKNFNPFSPTVAPQVQGMIYEPLFFFNALGPADAKAVPVLGTSYSFDSTGTKLSVTTRSGIDWSDGKPFTAKDVAFTMNLIHRYPALNTTGNAPTATATDDTHVTLTFARPSFTDGPNILGHTFIVPEHIWRSVKNPATAVNADPVGTGPLTMGAFTPQSYLLTKNPRFRDASKVAVGGIRMYSLSGNEAAADKLLAGGLDWAGIFVPDIAKTLGGKNGLAYVIWGSPTIVLNACSNAQLGCTGPQTDPVVRQAMTAAIDRDQVNTLAYHGTGHPPATTFVDPEDTTYGSGSTALPDTPDVKKADSLLEGDGWTKGSDGLYAKDGQKLSMTVQVTSGYTDYISILQAMTQEFATAGIGLQVQQVANQEVLSAASSGQYQLQIGSLQPGPTSDPYYVYSKYFLGSETARVGTSVNPYGNVARYSNPAVDQAIAAAGATQDVATKQKEYAVIQKAIATDLPYIPVLVNGASAEYSTRSLTGWPTKENLYAAVSPWAVPDNEQVLLHLTRN